MVPAADDPWSARLNDADATERLRVNVQRFTRSMCLLQVRGTPCEQPLSVVQTHTLMFLLARPPEPPTTHSILAAHLGVDKSTVTRVVAQLRARGLVLVEVCPDDRRVKCVSLTDDGRHMGERVDRGSRSLFEGVLQRIAPSEREGVIDAVQRLTRAIVSSGADL